MFHNYFFLKRLAHALHKRLAGCELLECFSQNKEELILGFASPDENLYLRANLDPQISLITVTDDFRRARKNSVDLFTPLIGKVVLSVEVFAYERSFSIHFEGHYQLLFKMHGSRSNLLLVHQNEVIQLFRNNLPNDASLTPATLHQSPDLSEAHFHEVNGDLQSFLPALGKEVKNFLSEKGYEESPVSERWQMLRQVLQQLETHPVCIFENQKGPALSLLPLAAPLFCTDNALESCNRYYELYTRTHYLYAARNQAQKALEDRIRKTENYLTKTREKLGAVKNQRKYDEIANILMANLHQIPKGQQEVTLHDFYSDQNVLIKLNPLLSPQKNAENLYRKAKNQQLEITNLEDNLARREDQLWEMMETLEALEKSDDIRAIRKLVPEKTTPAEEEKNLPYHEYRLSGYQILVGKNARANDLLTLKVAHKDDLWLHAKDVAGSHVVIRQQAGKKIPKDVLERAAELAAWYSKRKTDSLCPVIYTPKKYVRKRKGDPAGAVVVEKEEVILVVPKNQTIPIGS